MYVLNEITEDDLTYKIQISKKQYSLIIEDGLQRENQMRLMQALPYSLVQPGPKDIHGVGNYVLQVRSADKYVVFFL